MRICRKIAALGLCAVLLVSLISMVFAADAAPVLQFDENGEFKILIVADSRELIKPCGACLQRIAEFAAPETPVHLADSQNVRQTFKLSDLLPQTFNAEELSE